MGASSNCVCVVCIFRIIIDTSESMNITGRKRGAENWEWCDARGLYALKYTVIWYPKQKHRAIDDANWLERQGAGEGGGQRATLIFIWMCQYIYIFVSYKPKIICATRTLRTNTQNYIIYIHTETNDQHWFHYIRPTPCSCWFLFLVPGPRAGHHSKRE